MEMGDEEGYPVTKPKFAFLPGTASSMMSVVKPPRTPDRSTREYRRNEESTRDRCNEGQQVGIQNNFLGGEGGGLHWLLLCLKGF